MRKWSFGFGILFAGLILLASGCSLVAPDDKAIVSEIQAKLFQDSVLKTRDIRVTSNQGMVILTGTVSTELEKSAVERLAGQASGVKRVENELTVSMAGASENTPPVAALAPAEQPSEPSPPATPASAPASERQRTRRPEHLSAREAQRWGATRGHGVSTPVQEEPAPAPAPAQAPAPAPVQAAAPAPPPPPRPPQPVRVTVPAGTVITVRMIDSVDSSRNSAGDDFKASVEAAVVVGERVVIPRGADAHVRLVKAASAGRMSGQSELQLQLASVEIAGASYDTDTTAYDQKGSSRGKRTAETVGGGAILGGLIGAIAGHGKGAAIGSVIGAGAGTAAEAGTKAPPVRVSSETKLDFTLRLPVQVTLPPSGNTAE